MTVPAVAGLVGFVAALFLPRQLTVAHAE